jgi:hypothetical protein
MPIQAHKVRKRRSTSVGAVKAALHRGRGKLLEPEPAYDAAPVPAVLDAFCEAFNARDLNGLTALLLDSVVFRISGPLDRRREVNFERLSPPQEK